ncbi:PIF1-like helicase-domain-containing protein [Fomes fomentarius]|nr:PIF1-like helicase-domain-containing protein [Fomes fomentarius]
MPLPQLPWTETAANALLQQELDYDVNVLQNQVTANCQQFNNEQSTVFTTGLHSVDHNEGRIVFVHSAGGCGKTYVCNTIAAAVCAKRKVALAVASSGIASLLLVGG